MLDRPTAQEILKAQAAEFPISRKELFEEFGEVYSNMIDKRAIEALFGHEV